MRNNFFVFLIVFLFAFLVNASSLDRSEATLLLSSAALNEIKMAPDFENVSPILEEAVGIGIFPGLKKASYIVGGQFGKGVFLYKDAATKEWGAPAFYKIHGGSIGLQIGIQETDLILIFTTKESFRDIISKEYNINYNLAASAGPVGRDISKTHAEPVYAYSRSKGLFAGIAVSGVKLSFDFESTKDYYGEAYNSEMILIQNEVNEIPESAKKLIETLKNVI